MVKTKIIETTKKYDKDGKLVEKIVRKEKTKDDTDYTLSDTCSCIKEKDEYSYGGNIMTGFIPCDCIKMGKVTEEIKNKIKNLDFSSLKKEGETIC